MEQRKQILSKYKNQYLTYVWLNSLFVYESLDQIKEKDPQLYKKTKIYLTDEMSRYGVLSPLFKFEKVTTIKNKEEYSELNTFYINIADQKTNKKRITFISTLVPYLKVKTLGTYVCQNSRWPFKQLVEEASQYQNWNEFRTQSASAYHALLRFKRKMDKKTFSKYFPNFAEELTIFKEKSKKIDSIDHCTNIFLTFKSLKLEDQEKLLNLMGEYVISQKEALVSNGADLLTFSQETPVLNLETIQSSKTTISQFHSLGELFVHGNDLFNDLMNKTKLDSQYFYKMTAHMHPENNCSYTIHNLPELVSQYADLDEFKKANVSAFLAIKRYDKRHPGYKKMLETYLNKQNLIA